MIRFHCPTCRKKLKAPPEQSGRSGRCPGCQGLFHVPWVDGSDDPPPPPPVPLAPAPVSPPPPVVIQYVDEDDPPPPPPSGYGPPPGYDAPPPGYGYPYRPSGYPAPPPGYGYPPYTAYPPQVVVVQPPPPPPELPARRSRRRGFECPYCGCDSSPARRSQISTAGWMVFVMMILFCLPLFWVGLLITEEYRVCRDCGARLG